MAQEIIVIKISRSYRNEASPDVLTNIRKSTSTWPNGALHGKHLHESDEFQEACEKSVLFGNVAGFLNDKTVKEKSTLSRNGSNPPMRGEKSLLAASLRNRSAQHGSVKMQATSLMQILGHSRTRFRWDNIRHTVRRPLRLLQQVHLRLPHR